MILTDMRTPDLCCRIKPAMCAEGAKAISRWLSEAIPPVAEETLLAPLQGASNTSASSGGIAPLNRRLIAGAPSGLRKPLTVAPIQDLSQPANTLGHHPTNHSIP